MTPTNAVMIKINLLVVSFSFNKIIPSTATLGNAPIKETLLYLVNIIACVNKVTPNKYIVADLKISSPHSFVDIFFIFLKSRSFQKNIKPKIKAAKTLKYTCCNKTNPVLKYRANEQPRGRADGVSEEHGLRITNEVGWI